MQLDPAERQKLEDYQFMMGNDAGSLALVLDRLTDVMALVGQHTVYCRIEKGPHSGEATLDLAEGMNGLQTAKTLVQQTMQALRGAGGSPARKNAGEPPAPRR
jgi:hypothetical protein